MWGLFLLKENLMIPNKEKNNEKPFETLMPAPWAIAFKKPTSILCLVRLPATTPQKTMHVFMCKVKVLGCNILQIRGPTTR